MRRAELIFVPVPSPGHLVSAVEFSKRLVAHDARLSITILVLKSPIYPAPSLTTTSNIRYIDLPQVDPPPPELFKESVEHGASVFLASYVPHVRDAISHLHDSTDVRVVGVVLDMFCTSMIDVANEFHLPSYIFFCSSAAFLGLLLHLPSHQHSESDPETVIPCFQNRVPVSVFPTFSFNKLGCKAFTDHGKRFKETKGILVNTFLELEPYAVQSLAHDYETAPVYTVGPVLSLDHIMFNSCEAAERERIVEWLDKQPESSVVFLCFGSGGYFSEDQIREISKGLSQSGQRFLWSLRKPPSADLVKPIEYTEMEMKSVLGDEFWSLVEEGRGLVCGWAPQVEILAHGSTGAFVSHCGWNSTLESLWFGKPIVTWPMYAEQQINAFELVKELGIAVELTLEYRVRSSSLVEAGEVEKAVRSVMDKDNPVRYRIKEIMELCRRASTEAGSSLSCVDRLIGKFVGETESEGDI